MESELAQLISDQGLGSRVVIPGRIPHERVPGVYALIDVLAYPRYSMRLTELVTPLKPLEAMAMGKALVASDVGGHRELIRHGETGLLFKAGDETALAKQIIRLLVDHELGNTLQRQSRTWVQEHHSWERTAAVYRKIYSSVKRN
jgi:glycosyltransferase involved in cell wall biosynthesis